MGLVGGFSKVAFREAATNKRSNVLPQAGQRQSERFSRWKVSSLWAISLRSSRCSWTSNVGST
jgi:hypothetical protein